MSNTGNVQVTIKEQPALTAVGVRRRIKVSQETFGELFKEAFGKLKGAPAGPPLGRYFEEEFDPEDSEVELLIPVAQGGEIELPATKVASCLHVGPYDRIGETYGVLCAWVNEHLAGQGLVAAGPMREVYLVGPETGKPPAEWVTELQVPVA